jgi:hypothetical protein
VVKTSLSLLIKAAKVMLEKKRSVEKEVLGQEEVILGIIRGKVQLRSSIRIKKIWNLNNEIVMLENKRVN